MEIQETRHPLRLFVSLVKSFFPWRDGQVDGREFTSVGIVRFLRWEEADRDLQIALPNRSESRHLRRMLIAVNEKLGRQALADQHRLVLETLTEEGD